METEAEVTKLKEQVKSIWQSLDRHCKDIKEVSHNLDNFKIYMDKKITALDERMTEKIEKITQDLSKRLPLWATALITILSSLCVGLMVYAVK